jgi:hypothetical protein
VVPAETKDMSAVAQAEPREAPTDVRRLALRHRHLLLAAVATVLVMATASDRGFDLDLLVAGARGLAGHSTSYFGVVHGPSTGLHLYAAIPGIQVGPLALLFLLGFGASWGDPGHIACLVATVLGLLAIVMVERSVPLPSARTKAITLVGGVAVCICWADTVQRWGHVDDALVAVAAAGVVLAIRRERWILAGLLVGLAIGAKPTALPLATLLVTGPGVALFVRERVQSLVVAAVVAGAAYLPFLLADSRTVQAGAPQLPIQPASVLALFGATPGHPAPALVRAFQLALTLGLGLWAVRRNGALAGLLAVSAGRLLLDPGDYSYYVLPLVLAAVGIAIERRRWPTLAWCAMAALVIVPWADPVRHRWEGLLLLAVCLAAIATATSPPTATWREHWRVHRRVPPAGESRRHLA